MKRELTVFLECWSPPTGASAHTTDHYLRPTPTQITVTRRHQPLEGQTFEVLKGGKKDLLVQLLDGSTIKLPRSWTDADGTAALESSPATVFSLASVRELVALLDALKQRP